MKTYAVDTELLDNFINATNKCTLLQYKINTLVITSNMFRPLWDVFREASINMYKTLLQYKRVQ